jgi:hypothetical protein
MSDTIQDTPESIERVIGEALTARSISIDFFSGVGPADLCCITKQFVRAWLPYNAGAECLPVGYYHYCQGADVSCPAAISAYFQSLLSGMSKGSWYSSGEYRVKKAVFCVYDCFRRVDVRCEVTFPGCVAAYAVTAKGDRLEMQPDDWPSAFVSSSIRAMLDPPALHAVKIFPLLSTPVSEKLFFSSLSALVARSASTMCDAVHGCCDASHNVIISTVMRYLMSLYRLEEVETFCARHMADAPGLVQYAAAAEVIRGNVDAACAMTAAAAHAAATPPLTAVDTNAALQSCILSAQSLTLRCKCSSVGGGVADNSRALALAIETAQEAARLCPYNLQAWLMLCKAYAAAKDWASMLITINSIPFHLEKKMGKRGQVSVDGSPVQDASCCTAPTLTPDPSRMSLFDFHHGDADFDYSSAPGDHDKFPGSKVTGISKEVYSLVVEAMNNSSWDELLEIRSSVFLMKEEEKLSDIVASTSLPSIHGDSMQGTDSVADAAVDVDRSASVTSPDNDEQPAAETSVGASNSVSAECSSPVDDGANARSSYIIEGLGTEQSSEAVSSDVDPDAWRAELAISVARMLFCKPVNDHSSVVLDAHQVSRFSASDLEALLQTNKSISPTKLKRVLKKFAAKSSSTTVEDIADVLLSLSDENDDESFRNVIDGYMLHLVGIRNEQLDSAVSVSIVAETASVSFVDSNHTQASLVSDLVDCVAVPFSTAGSTAPATAPSAEKFLCKPWLDSIFMAIYGDLVA